MQIVTEKLRNGNEINYKIVNGTAYHIETPDEVVAVLENYRGFYAMWYKKSPRVRLFFGDTRTGKDTLEEYETMGYVGRSTGNIKVPLLIHNERSRFGGAILDHCIVRITVDGVEKYRHPQYYQGTFEIKPNPYDDKPEYIEAVFVDGVNHAAFTKAGQAAKWIEFMKGNKNRK